MVPGVDDVDAFDPSGSLAAAGKGDQRAWDAIVTAYSGLVWAVARGHRLTSADAADVYQATWLRLVEHLGDIRDPGRLGSWLATTARREALALLRRRRDVPMADPELLPAVAADAGDPVDGNLLRGEERRALWQAFHRLSDSCQRLLRLVFADPPLTYAEVSAALDIPVGSIGPSRARCLAHLRALLPRGQ